MALALIGAFDEGRTSWMWVCEKDIRARLQTGRIVGPVGPLWGVGATKEPLQGGKVHR